MKKRYVIPVLVVVLVVLVGGGLALAGKFNDEKQDPTFPGDQYRGSPDPVALWMEQNKDTTDVVDRAILNYLQNYDSFAASLSSSYVGGFGDAAYAKYILGLDMKYLPDMVKKIESGDFGSYMLIYAVSEKTYSYDLRKIAYGGPERSVAWLAKYKELNFTVPARVKEISAKYRAAEKRLGTRCQIDGNSKEGWELARYGLFAMPSIIDEMKAGGSYLTGQLETLDMICNGYLVAFPDFDSSDPPESDRILTEENNSGTEAIETEAVDQGLEPGISVDQFCTKHKDKIEAMRLLTQAS